jgi:hypothetical protein
MLFQVRWFDLLDFEKNLLPVQQARKGLGEGLVLIPEPSPPKEEQKVVFSFHFVKQLLL